MSVRHGKWHGPEGFVSGGGGQHPGYCEASGAHTYQLCGVTHAGADGPCPVRRVTCPGLGRHFVVVPAEGGER